MKKSTNTEPTTIFSQRVHQCDDVLKDVEQNITTVIEATRIKYGFTRDEYSKLLGISPSTYTTSINTWKRIKNPVAIIRFCYIFGYDFETLVTSPLVAFENDMAVTKLGIHMSSLSDESLSQLSTFVQTLDEPSENRNGLAAAIINYQNSRDTYLNLVSTRTFSE